LEYYRKAYTDNWVDHMRLIIYMNDRSDKRHLTDAGTNFARWIAPWGADTQPWAVILNPFHRRWFLRRFVRITDAGTNFARWIAPWGADTQPWAVILNPFHRRWFHRRFVRITEGRWFRRRLVSFNGCGC
jgi:hypothetical protein